MWFYKIEKNVSENKMYITYNSLTSYFKNIIGIIGIIACANNNILIACSCLGILAITLTYYLIRYGSLIRWLKILEKQNLLLVSGNRYSFKNPLKITVLEKYEENRAY